MGHLTMHPRKIVLGRYVCDSDDELYWSPTKIATSHNSGDTDDFIPVAHYNRVSIAVGEEKAEGINRLNGSLAPELIWLEPVCKHDLMANTAWFSPRLWCCDDVWDKCECGCGRRAIPYVREES